MGKSASPKPNRTEKKQRNKTALVAPGSASPNDSKLSNDIVRFQNTSNEGMDLNTSAEVNQNIQKALASATIQKASSALRLDNNGESGDLIIENERLKTTIMVLNQKLNDWVDTEREMHKLRKNNRELTHICDQQVTEISNLKSDLSQRDSRISTNE